MPFNGAGGFVSLGGATFPAVPGTTILASQYNDQLNDIFGGLGQVITRNGQSPWTANLPAGGFKLTNLAAGSSTNDSVAFGQAAVTFGTVTAAVTGASSLNVLKAGDTMSGALAINIPGGEAISLRGTGVNIAGYDSTVTTQYGFLQFNGTPVAVTSVVLKANGAGVLQLLSAGGGLAIAPTGVISTTGLFDSSAFIRSTGSSSTPAAGSGIELLFNAGSGILQAFNRTGAAYLPLVYSATQHSFQISGVAQATLDASGVLNLVQGPSVATSSIAMGSFNSTNASGGYLQFLKSGVGYGFVGYGGILGGGTTDMVLRAENALNFGTSGGATSSRVSTNGEWGFNCTPVGGSPARFQVNGSNDAGIEIQRFSSTIAGLLSFNRNATAYTRFRVDAADFAFLIAGATTALTLTASAQVDVSQGSGKLFIGGTITRFESAEQTCPSGTLIASVAHGGPRKPDNFKVILRCKTAEAGFSIGDEISICDAIVDPARACMGYANATNVGFNYTGAGVPPSVRNTSGALVAITAANWRIVYYCLWL